MDAVAFCGILGIGAVVEQISVAVDFHHGGVGDLTDAYLEPFVGGSSGHNRPSLGTGELVEVGGFKAIEIGGQKGAIRTLNPNVVDAGDFMYFGASAGTGIQFDLGIACRLGPVETIGRRGDTCSPNRVGAQGLKECVPGVAFDPYKNIASLLRLPS